MTDLPPNETVVRVVDDDAAVLKSWKFLIEGDGWTVRAYDSAGAFLKGDNPGNPGCLVLDVRMPEMTGLELQRKMAELGMKLPIIFVSGHGDIDMAVQTMKDGAVDFLPKPVSADRLLTAIQTAVQKDLDRRSTESETVDMVALYNSLTPREKYISRLIGRGYLYKQIAYELGISQKTVQVHRTSISKKLRCRSNMEISKLLRDIGEI